MTEAAVMLRAKDAAAYIAVSVRTMYTLPIPHYILGPRLIRWARADLDAYLASCRRDPRPQERVRITTSRLSLADARAPLVESFRRLGIDVNRAGRGKIKTV